MSMPSDPLVVAVQQFTVAEHTLQQFIKEQEPTKELREERTKLRVELLEYLQKNNLQCLPTNLTDPAGKTLFLRLSTQIVPHAPTVERVTEAINRVDVSLLVKTMQDLDKAEVKKKKATGKKRAHDDTTDDKVLTFKKKKGVDGTIEPACDGTTDKCYVLTPTVKNELGTASASSSTEPWALQVLKTALKKQLREVHVTKKQVSELSTSQVRGFKLDVAQAKVLFSKDLEDKVSKYRGLGMDIATRIKHQKSATINATKVKQEQHDKVKDFLLAHGDAENANSRKIIVDDQPYRIEITTTDRAKPLTLPAMDGIINAHLEKVLEQKVHDIRSMNRSTIDWSSVWTADFKSELIKQVLYEMGKWKVAQRTVSHEVKMRALKPRRPDNKGEPIDVDDEEDDLQDGEDEDGENGDVEYDQ